MKLHMQSDSAVTLIENIFIDRYMPAANGEFVKLYLYLLRCAGSGREISISSIADFFDHTEKDVRRALTYWEKLDLLRLAYDSADNITDIVFLSGNDRGTAACISAPAPSAKSSQAAAEPAPMQDHACEAESVVLPSKRDLSPSRRKELHEQQEIRQIVFVGEQYWKRPLTTTEINTILYFYDCLHFSQDLIIYLLEYCADKDNPGVRYMERVALEWFKAGITTVEQAKQCSVSYTKEYYSVFNALGLGDRKITPAEKEYIDRWLSEYHFSIDLICEACARTIIATHEPSFNYTESILAGWYKNQVRTKEDIQKLDQEHAALAAAAPKNTAGRSTGKSGYDKNAGSRTAKNGHDNRFTRIAQRDYNWQELEKELLKSQTAGPSA